MSISEQLPVFVYGTLRNGLSNYKRLLTSRTSVETPGILRGYSMYTNGGFPMIVEAAESDLVSGEVMWIRSGDYSRVIADLDRLEGFRSVGDARNLYNRETVEVDTVAGVFRCYAYIWNMDVTGLVPVPHGDYKAFLKEEFQPS
jgi:gamma-glutamylcyclotransferase (GGCT)/AIG2-like uncharacterized protein YtfP